MNVSDNRVGMAEFTLPPNSYGPPAHWHEMHDELFLTTQGTVRYHMPLPEDAIADTTTSAGDGLPDEPYKVGNSGRPEKIVDAKLGDLVTVPIRAPHTFSNPFDEEAKFVNTYSPAFYINYFRMLGEMISEGEGMVSF
jgi:oxalate decarboxylase/phosphoglucose isomerase-like protein (cupin superfamily)